MLLVMVIVQAGMWYLAREAALAAARQGADAARLPGASAGAGPQAALRFAHDSASGYLLSPAATASGSTSTTVQITVCGHVPTFVPGLRFTVTQAVQAPVEQFAVPGGTSVPPGGAASVPANASSAGPPRAVVPAQCPGGG